MANLFQYKIEFEGSLRRGSVPRTSSFEQVRCSIASLLGLKNGVKLQYRDQDQDLITIGSEQEWFDLVREYSEKPLRLIASKPGDESSTPIAPAEPHVQHEAGPEPEPEIPFADLAKALSDPAVIGKIQATVNSPIVTNAVNSVARAYIDTKGDLGATGMAGANQIPLLMGLVSELLDQVPELKDVSQQAFASGAEHFFGGGHGPFHHAPPPPPFFCGTGGHMFGGGRPCGPPPSVFGSPMFGHFGGPGNPHCKTVHPHVFCDGCSSDHSLKRIAFANGHMTRRGFINGLRFKSQSVDNFDLCESCKVSDRFPDRTYGPFDTIQPPHTQSFGGRGRGGCWRGQAPAQPHPSQVPAQQKPSTQEPANKPFDFGDVLREAIVRGAQTVAEVTKKDDADFSELARAIAASLQLSSDKVAAPAEEKTVEAVPVVESVSKENGGSTSEGEWEAVPLASATSSTSEQRPTEDPFVKWGSELHQLATLGFSDSETYVRFLDEENGDLDRVVSRIVSRDA